MFILLTYTPWRAYMDGLLVFPNILISDTIACSPWHRSIYTTGISMAALSSCVIYSEFARALKMRIWELPKDVQKSAPELGKRAGRLGRQTLRAGPPLAGATNSLNR